MSDVMLLGILRMPWYPHGLSDAEQITYLQLRNACSEAADRIESDEKIIAALRAENERLKNEKRELVEAIKESIKTCNGINTADYRTWEDGLNTKDEFIVWSKSRCGWQSDRLKAALEGKE